MKVGFTLIELLVVITIIVVLLALLTPALDKAIYQAELAVCAASLDAGASGMISYVMGFRRQYPDRGTSGNAPRVFGGGANNDFRPKLSDFISINGLFNDPLLQDVDYNDPDGQHGYAARFIWPSFKFASGSAMTKMGQKWTFTDTQNYPEPRTFRFGVLVSDIDFNTTNVTQQWGSHPDADGVLTEKTCQDEVPPEHERVPGFGVNRFVMARWWIGGGAASRGLVDLNFGMDDGSVIRFDDVSWNDTHPGNEHQTRLRGVPWNASEQFVGATLCSVPLAN